MNIASTKVPINPPATVIQPTGNGGTDLARILSVAIGVMTIVAAIWFMFKIILGGIAIINSDGDPKAVAAARGSITSGVIGLVVIISATFILGLIGFVLGFNNLLDVAGFINRL